jgi:rhodanese-related sulfurtransferase
VSRDQAVIDVGGGASTFVDHLLARGFSDVSVLDVSQAALAMTRDRVGSVDKVQLVHADIVTWRAARLYSLWHDRAVFHFLVDAADRKRYLDILRSSVLPGGHAVIATFAPDGPDRCSGLPVARYGPDDLRALLDGAFEVLEVRREEHTTPAGITQPFTWVAARALRNPDTASSIDQLLAQVRSAFTRLAPHEAAEAMLGGALLIDTRPLDQRQRDGCIPGALVIDRNVLEWRLDPSSADRIDDMTHPDQVVMVICNEGYSSSLAAATLQRLGLRHACDVTGGFQAWAASGLPVVRWEANPNPSSR